MAYYFIQQIVKGAAGKGIRIHSEAERALLQYSWPGNGRELFHTFQQILHHCVGDSIRRSDLPAVLRASDGLPPRPKASTLAQYMAAAENRAIEDALIEAGGNKSKAAEILGIHRTLLYRKMKKLQTT